MNQPPAASQPSDTVKRWCETCEGDGYVFQEPQAGCHVGGDHPCPDCDGKGYWFASQTPAASQPTPGTEREACPYCGKPLINCKCWGEVHNDAARFRFLCMHPDWRFIELLCQEFVAESSREFYAGLCKAIDKHRAALDTSKPPAASQPSDEGEREIIATYKALHKDKLGAHWLWVVIEQIAAGVPEDEAFKSFGYYEAGPSRSHWDAKQGAPKC